MRLYGSQAISLLPPVGQQFIYIYPLQLLPTTFPIIHPLPPYSRHYLSHIQPLHLVQFWVSQSRPSMRHFTLLELSPLREKTQETFHGIYQKKFDTPTIITHNCLTMSLYIFTMFIMYPQHIIYVAIYRVDCAKSDKFLL